jgi:hypothetical protein
MASLPFRWQVVLPLYCHLKFQTRGSLFNTAREEDGRAPYQEIDVEASPN